MGRHILNSASPQLGNAAAAILVLEDGHYLLQLRDDKPGIWYPGHWGLFGGAVEAGENEITALKRELREEIELDLDVGQPRLFTRFEFDLRPVGKERYFRSYYDVQIPPEAFARLILHEGVEMRAFPAEEALRLRLSPYDNFALFLHYQQAQLSSAF